MSIVRNHRVAVAFLWRCRSSSEDVIGGNSHPAASRTTQQLSYDCMAIYKFNCYYWLLLFRLLLNCCCYCWDVHTTNTTTTTTTTTTAATSTTTTTLGFSSFNCLPFQCLLQVRSRLAQVILHVTVTFCRVFTASAEMTGILACLTFQWSDFRSIIIQIITLNSSFFQSTGYFMYADTVIAGMNKY